MIEILMNLDSGLLLFIQDNLRAGILNPLFVFITTIGNSGTVWILISLGLLIPKKTRKIGIVCIAALAMSFIINNLLLKNIVARERPFQMFESILPLIPLPTDWSFPSGHSAASFACAWVIFKETPHRFGIPALVLAVLIAFSRLYVGVHYPSDVLAGAASGILIGIFAEKVISCRLLSK